MYNKNKHLFDNFVALSVAVRMIDGSVKWTKEETNKLTERYLRKYTGFGGLKAALFFPDLVDGKDDALKNIIANLDGQFPSVNIQNVIEQIATLRNLTPKEVAESIASSVLTAFYTPQPVITAVGNAVAHTLEVNGVKMQSFIETSAGIGGFLPVAMAGCQKVAFEKDVATSVILEALHKDTTQVFNAGFETIDEQRKAHNLPMFDVAASNIPFGDVKVADSSFYSDEVHRFAKTKLHTYFFLKGMEQLKDGGILAFITSRGIADAQGNQIIRDWLVSNGNLLAALRLPDNLFMDGSGVEVGSDLLIFQRDTHKSWQTVSEQMFTEVIDKSFGGKTIRTNRLLGQLSQGIYTSYKTTTNQYGTLYNNYRWSGTDEQLERTITDHLSRSMELYFLRSTWDLGHTVPSVELPTQPTSKRAEAAAARLAAARERLAALRVEMRPMYDSIMSAYTSLMTSERRERKANITLRGQLNAAYDEFVEKYGTLHAQEKAVSVFPEVQLALSLERKDADGNYVKADVFQKPIAYAEQDDNADITPLVALTMSLNNYGNVNMGYMRQLTMLSDAEIYEELKGEIFFTNNGWEHKSRVINGNVVRRRKEIESYLSDAKVDDMSRRWLTDTIEALRTATPTPIPYEEIDIQLGVRWLPTECIDAFAMQIFKAHSSPGFKYCAELDEFTCERVWDAENDSYWSEWGVVSDDKRYTGWDILGYALKDSCPVITKTIGETKVKDTRTMRMVQRKIDEMRERFVSFMHSTAITEKLRTRIATLYNETMNCYVRHQFDGSHQTLPGLDTTPLGFSDLYASQKDAIWMLKQNGGGVCWHEVGAGKTMIMCCAAYEMHRLGLANKPLIIGMKANVHQIAETMRLAYPSARVLYPGKEDFTTANRLEFFQKITNNDWDCVIMTHDQFKKIPHSAETQRAVLQSELDDVEAALEYIHDAKMDYATFKRLKRELEKRKENLRVKMRELNDRIASGQDETVNFHTMGIDHIFVDEYQEFKNLAFSTRHGRVPGIGDNSGSQKAMHLLMAIRDIQMRRGTDLCASFFSGTIIKNALTELYVLFKYLRPNELRRQHISCFDAWAAVFAKKSTDYDITITGEIQAKERFRQYLNVPELAAFLREITDYRTAEMINIDRPRANVVFDQKDPTSEQRIMIDRLCEFAKSGSWSTLGLGDKVKMPANLDKSKMLVATDVARKVALDPRILSVELFGDDPDSKAARCADKLAEYYTRFNAHKGTQFVFCDISTYKKGDASWNIYNDIARKLTRFYGIPAEEIAFIQKEDTEQKRKQLFEKLNDGRVRIVFGSTKMLGTGVNAQQRAVAVHHLDIPWTPADLEQRNGRAVRKGNEVKLWGGNQVDVIIYGTSRTLDSYKFQLLKNKDTFIKQICQGTLASRHIDEDQMDEQTGMNFAEYVAVLSGNQDLLKKARLDNKIAGLERDQAEHQRSVTNAISALANVRKAIVEHQRIIANLNADLAHTKAVFAKGITLNVPGAKDQTAEEQSRRLFALRAEQHADGDIRQVATICGLPVMMHTSAHVNILSGKTDVDVTYSVKCHPSGTLYKIGRIGNSLETASHTFDALPTILADTLEKRSNQLADDQARIPNIEEATRRTYDDTTLRALRAERDELQARIDAELDSKQQAVIAAAEAAEK